MVPWSFFHTSLEVIMVTKKHHEVPLTKQHSESGTFRPDLLAASKRKSIWEGGDGKVPKGVKAPMAPAMFNPPMPARSSGRPWESCQRGGPSARCNKASVFTAAASWRRWIFATCSYRMMKMFQLKWTFSSLQFHGLIKKRLWRSFQFWTNKDAGLPWQTFYMQPILAIKRTRVLFWV